MKRVAAVWLALSLVAGCSVAGCSAEDEGSSMFPSGQTGGAGGAAGAMMMLGGSGGASGAGGMGSGGTAGVIGTAGSAGGAGVTGGSGGGAGIAGMSGGSGGAAGMMIAGEGGMNAGAGGMNAGAGGEMPREDLGEGDGSDVIAIGDSWMNLGSVGIQQSLAAASGQPYRQYGVPGTRLLDGVIPGQYADAKAENADIKTVVVTGGGNDILQDPGALLDCPALGDLCKDIIDMVGAAFLDLAEEMAADGVEDVIIINYSRNTLLGAEPIEYAYEAIGPLCETAPLRCHLVDPDEVAGGPMELRDGIHPTDANYDLLGEHIYELMVTEGMRR